MSQYVQLSPHLDPGFLAANPLVVTPATLPIELTNILTGRIEYNELGNLYPQLVPPMVVPFNDALDALQESSGVLPALGSDNEIQNFAAMQALHQALSNYNIGEVQSGCMYRIQIFGTPSLWLPIQSAPNTYNFENVADDDWLNELMYDYTALVVPQVKTNYAPPSSYVVGGITYNYGASHFQYLNSASGMPAGVQHGSLEGVSTQQLLNDQHERYNLQVVVIGKNCTPPYAGDMDPMTGILPPPAITLPGGVSMNVPAPGNCPPSTIIGGSIMPAAPGQPATVNFVQTPNGQQQMNLTLPNCTCKDGITPTFSAGKLTQIAAIGLKIALRVIAPEVYAMDINVPPSVIPFTELTLQVPRTNLSTGKTELTQYTVHCPSDGTNDMADFLSVLLQQILEIRGGKGLNTTPQFIKIGKVE